MAEQNNDQQLEKVNLKLQEGGEVVEPIRTREQVERLELGLDTAEKAKVIQFKPAEVGVGVKEGAEHKLEEAYQKEPSTSKVLTFPALEPLANQKVREGKIGDATEIIADTRKRFQDLEIEKEKAA